MCTYVAEGATIITAKDNEAYYKEVFRWPRTLYNPDVLAQRPSPLKIQPVTVMCVLTGGECSVEIYTLPCERHAVGSVMVYPQLSNADFLTAGDTSPSCLIETLDRQKIEVRQIAMAPIHGGNVAPLARPQ